MNQIPELKIYNTSKDLAENAAIQFHSRITSLEGETQKINIALSGGNTPGLLFTELAENYKHKIDWRKINLFWVDERCVPPYHQESNYGMTKDKLIRFIEIPEENIYRIRGENNPAEEAERYSKEITSVLKINGGIPVFDIILMGIGDDGHTASIFPDQMHLLNSEKICEVAVHPVSGQRRITMTGRLINNSSEIIFIVSGLSKAHVMLRLFDSPTNADDLPANHIKPVGNLEWWVDKEAAHLISGR